MFLEREALRLRRERFARAGDLSQVSMAETLAALLEELRRLRVLAAELQHGPDVTASAPETGNGAASGQTSSSDD